MNVKGASLTGVIFSLLAASCSEGIESPPVADQMQISESGGEWVTILERSLDARSAVPEPFETRSDSLRIITSMGALLSPYTPGLIVTNLVLRESLVPVASIRAEQRLVDETTVDTSVVRVGDEDLSFFVAEHRGLSNWTVILQEPR